MTPMIKVKYLQYLLCMCIFVLILEGDVTTEGILESLEKIRASQGDIIHHLYHIV